MAKRQAARTTRGTGGGTGPPNGPALTTFALRNSGAVLVYAVRHKAIASNPVDGVDFSANSAQRRNRRHHPLTTEQVAAVAASIGARHPREPGDRVQLQRIVTRSQLLTSNLQHPGAITLGICPPSWSQPRLSCHRTRVVPTGRTSERRPPGHRHWPRLTPLRLNR